MLDDPAVSDWLHQAIARQWERDPLDALNDAQELVELLTTRWNGVKNFRSDMRHKIETWSDPVRRG